MQTANQTFVPIQSADQYQQWEQDDRLPVFDADQLPVHRPDAHWIRIQNQTITARCSLWWRETPVVGGRHAGVIGHYAAADEQAAAELLDFACRKLAAHGAQQVLGPMNQNTWHDYRFVIETSDQPPFLFEPTNPPAAPQAFLSCGFQLVASYFSALVEDLTIESSRLQRTRERMNRQGIRLRTMDTYEEDMQHIYSVASIAFQDHKYFSPISEAAFIDLYRPLQHSIPTDLILLAEHAGEVIGFCFAIPDLLQAQRDETVDTLIVKTFGTLPNRQFAGLGQVMLEETQQRAAARGFKRGIHALVREGGAVQNISKRYATPIRRYGLFGKELELSP